MSHPANHNLPDSFSLGFRLIGEALIDSIRGGSFVFAYYPDPAWLKQSRLLSADCGSGVAARPASSAAGR